MWFPNYFFVKFLEILTTGSLEIGKFLLKQSVSFSAAAHALRLIGFFEGSFGNKEKLRIAGVFSIVAFSNISL